MIKEILKKTLFETEIKKISQQRKEIETKEKKTMEAEKELEKRRQALERRVQEILTEERKEIKEGIKRIESRVKEVVESSLNKKVKRISQEIVGALLKYKRRNQVKILIDGENLRRDLEALGREDTDILEVLRESTKALLRENEKSNIIFCDTYEKESEDRMEKEMLYIDLRNNSVEVRLIPPKFIVQEMKRKSRLDALVIVELLRTIEEIEYGRVILFAGDSDYEEPLKEIKRYNIVPMVIASQDSLAQELKRIATTFYLEEFLPKVSERERL